MAKTIKKLFKVSKAQQREFLYDDYMNKYYNLFMNRYKFTNVSEQQNHYLLNSFWEKGQVLAFLLKNEGEIISNEENPNGVIVFTPFAPQLYNIYDYPINATAINTRGVSFIPSKPMEINKECVIGYAQHSHTAINVIVNMYVSRIVDIDMVIQAQLNSHKIPFVVKYTPESESTMRKLFENIENDADKLYINAGDSIDNIQALEFNGNFLIDKLYSYKQQVENELLTYLGINNAGIMEKKEHLITDEVNSNNDLISTSGDCIFDSLKEFTTAVNEILNYPLDIISNEPEPKEIDNDKEEEEIEDDE